MEQVLLLGTVKCTTVGDMVNINEGATYPYTDEGRTFYVVIDNNGQLACVGKANFEVVEVFPEPRPLENGLDLEKFVVDVKEGKVRAYVLVGVRVDNTSFMASSVDANMTKLMLQNALNTVNKAIEENPQWNAQAPANTTANEGAPADNVTPLPTVAPAGADSGVAHIAPPKEIPADPMPVADLADSAQQNTAVDAQPVAVTAQPTTVADTSEDVNTIQPTEESHDQGEIAPSDMQTPPSFMPAE